MKKDIIEFMQETFVEYASPILINNLPSIDGLLPVNRKVIWGMNEAKIRHDKPFTKMLRATGHILPFYTFGDMPLTSAMKNMGNNSINITYLMPKGAYGDKRRKNADGASPRYIECKLSEYAEDMLLGIDKQSVPMKKNYDNTKDEPIILPSKNPNILINTSQSIAVGESSKIPSHNVNEVCDCFIEYINSKDIDKCISMLNGCDFKIGGQIINDRNAFEKIYKTGKGSFRLVGKYKYDEINNEVTIYEVPYEAYIENIEEEIRDKVESGIFKEVLDTHNGTDKNGLNLKIYLRKNTDIDKFIFKLRKHTSFEKSFSCNFTLLDMDGKTPKLMNLENIMINWIQHRRICLINEHEYDLNTNEIKLNRLYGLKKINEDLDKTISLIRESKTESIAIGKLNEHFNLNEEQSDYIVKNVKLININEEWIEKRIIDINDLEIKINNLKNIINNECELDKIIIKQLIECKEKYGHERYTTLLDDSNCKATEVKELLVEDYNCQIQLSNESYFKKTRLTGLNASNKLKDGDKIKSTIQCTNKDEVVFLTEDLNGYKYKLYELEETKLSNLGTYMQSQLKQNILGMIAVSDLYKYAMIVYNDGNIAKISIDSYKTLQNRQCLSKSLKNSDVFGVYMLEDDSDVNVTVSDGRIKQFNTSELMIKKSRNAGGTKIMTWKKVNIVDIEIIKNI